MGSNMGDVSTSVLRPPSDDSAMERPAPFAVFWEKFVP